jgi:hypothetical protein
VVTRPSTLADLYGWGDLSKADYRRLRPEAEAAVSTIPAPNDRLAQFDQVRDVIASLPDVLAEATLEASSRSSPCSLSAWRRGSGASSASSGCPPHARSSSPSRQQRTALVWRPRTVLGERRSHADPLAWYAA